MSGTVTRSPARATASALADMKSGLSNLQQGICSSIDWTNGLANVIVSGGAISIPMLGAAPPIPQQKCWVGWIGQQALCLGPVPRSMTGKVTTAPASGVLGFTGDDGTVKTIAYDSTITFALNDRIIVDWWSGGFAFAKLSADPITLDPVYIPPPVVSPVAQEKSLTFDPNGSGTWSTTYSKWQDSNVWCSDSTLGAWFYAGIADTIPDTATILEIRVYVDAFYTTGSDPTIGVHSLAGATGAPAVSSAGTVPGGTGWKNLPTALGDLLKTGAALGLGTNHGGYHKWSRAGVNNSGALFIRWRT
ncbi:hypothetical protein IT072_03615 [Leifsonia sp. ZF2019]|uniref:hypothetical protein n=1 Tax=Leifsonia sp. ZF2019 TaxID=2781978 RepID=UPI001CBE0749|nr:hypothetical protein [Leifsonia sp. ZF2019]UAJ80146.1 hypothetical protein IT072_03615 [Leifsonia sp. ZF2019]